MERATSPTWLALEDIPTRRRRLVADPRTKTAFRSTNRTPSHWRFAESRLEWMSKLFWKLTPKVSCRLSGNNMTNTNTTEPAKAVSSTDLLGLSDTPMTDAVEHTRVKLKQFRTPAYGDMMAHANRLERENTRLRGAIQSAIDYANGRESEWGARAEEAFFFLYRALQPNAQDHRPLAGEEQP